MLKRIKLLLLGNKIGYIAILITIGIAFLSLVDLSQSYVPKIQGSDKVKHSIAYFTLALSWLLTFQTKATTNKKKLLIIISCLFYGIILEVLQGELTSYRTADIYDVLANSIGILLAVVVNNKLRLKK